VSRRWVASPTRVARGRRATKLRSSADAVNLAMGSGLDFDGFIAKFSL
jgi:hypothetical protein